MNKSDRRNKTMVKDAFEIYEVFSGNGADKIWYKYAAPMLDSVVEEDTVGLSTVIQAMLDDFNDLAETYEFTDVSEEAAREMIDRLYDTTEDNKSA